MDTQSKDIDQPSAVARAEAAAWIARLHGPARSAELENGLQRWLREKPANAKAFERMTDSWELATSAAAGHFPRIPEVTRPRATRRWTLAAGAAMACLVLAVALQLWWRNPSYVTQIGEQRTVRLDDGSRISLNSVTRIAVDYSQAQRRVYLEEGEAFFEVAANPLRPFVVDAGGSEVTAVGTTFTVRYEQGKLAVVLVEGKVIVASESPQLAAGESPQVTLLPGERLTLSAQDPPHVDKPRAGSVATWRRGEIILDNTTLAEAAREMNRYDKVRLLIEDGAVGGLLVGGIFRTGDNLGFARAMAELHHLRLVQEDGRIRLLRGDAGRQH